MKSESVRKGIRKIRRSTVALSKRLKTNAVNLLYQLPLVSARNPRKHVVRIKDTCQMVGAFPGSTPNKDWYLRIRSSEVVVRKPSLSTNNTHEALFQAAVDKLQGGLNREIPEVFLASLNNARIFNDSYIISSSSNRILFESALSLNAVLEQSGIYEQLLPSRRSYLPGPHCVITSPWSSNSYYHWLIDALPRLSILEQFPEIHSLPLLVPTPLKNFQRQSLQEAGIKEEQYVSLNAPQTVIEKLYYPELLSPTGNPSPHAIAWLRQRFSDVITTERRPFRKLYVSRRDSTRTVINEDELVSYLLTEGFEVICAGDFSFSEQVRLFSEALVVIAPHGAALTNLVFSPAETTLIELFGDNYINGCFWALTNIRMQEHAYLIGKANGLNYTIDLDDLKFLWQRLRR